MSDQFEDNSNTVDYEEPDTNMDEFLPTDTNPLEGVDVNQVVTIRTSSGQSHYVATTEPLTLQSIKEKSGLTFAAGTQIFLNNAIIADDTVVPAGATIVAVGSVKGGSSGGRS